MPISETAERLLGRRRERAVLERLLDTSRDGHGAVLVVHGDPGVGKTALLEYAVEAGEGFRVVQAAGVEGEMELDYAALQQLCRRSSSSSSVSLILSVTRSASPSGSAPDRRPARISSGSRFSASSPKLPSSNRSCVWSTTRSGSPPAGGEDRTRVRDA